MSRSRTLRDPSCLGLQATLDVFEEGATVVDLEPHDGPLLTASILRSRSYKESLGE